ncbi:MAG: hypothetical protein Q7T35_00695 [Nitrosomonas sp.]|nr:hypothetical protein [Nitrosomonas sp.]
MKARKWIEIISLISILITASHQGIAASPDAWVEHHKEVKEKCIQSSNLLQARSAGDVVDFSDEIGFSILIVKGVHKFDKKTSGTEGCLLNRSNRSISITETDQLIIP